MIERGWPDVPTYLMSVRHVIKPMRYPLGWYGIASVPPGATAAIARSNDVSLNASSTVCGGCTSSTVGNGTATSIAIDARLGSSPVTPTRYAAREPGASVLSTNFSTSGPTDLSGPHGPVTFSPRYSSYPVAP